MNPKEKKSDDDQSSDEFEDISDAESLAEKNLGIKIDSLIQISF
jgi:hypothetical protein